MMKKKNIKLRNLLRMIKCDFIKIIFLLFFYFDKINTFFLKITFYSCGLFSICDDVSSSSELDRPYLYV